MPSTMGTRAAYGTSPTRDRVTQLYRQMVGSASDESAHQRMRTTETRFMDMVRLFARAAAVTRIERLRTLFDEAARTDPTCTTDCCLLDATRREIHADAQQDVARLEVAIESGCAAETRLLRALYAELAAKREVCAILEARKEARRV